MLQMCLASASLWRRSLLSHHPSLWPPTWTSARQHVESTWKDEVNILIGQLGKETSWNSHDINHRIHFGFCLVRFRPKKHVNVSPEETWFGRTNTAGNFWCVLKKDPAVWLLQRLKPSWTAVVLQGEALQFLDFYICECVCCHIYIDLKPQTFSWSSLFLWNFSVISRECLISLSSWNPLSVVR